MEGVNICKDSMYCADCLEDIEVNSKKTETETHKVGESSMQLPLADETNPELPIIKIYKVEPSDEVEIICESRGENKHNLIRTRRGKVFNPNDHFTTEAWLKVCHRRDIFPEVNERTYRIYRLPHFRCCFIEHNYCKTKRYGLGTLKDPSQIPKPTCWDKQSENTCSFENRPGKENRVEQEKTDEENSTTKHVDSDADSSSTSSSQTRSGQRPVNENIGQSLLQSVDVTDAETQDKTVKQVTPKIRIRKSSKGDGEGYDIVLEERSPRSLLSPVHIISKQLNKTELKLEKRKFDLNVPNKAGFDERAVNFGVAGTSVMRMEKGTQSSSEAFGRSVEKMYETVAGSSSEIVPFKLRKLAGKEDAPESQKEKEYSRSVLNPKKPLPGEKNWNVEYTEQCEGLDDLLLRASELNAENFTKALGQNSGGRNANNKSDSSEIVLSFPGSKREAELDPLELDNSRLGNVKKTKLEFFKKCVKDDKVVRAVDDESSKKVPELPKRAGIKVKTVQNINEEFKDSLGAKLKILEGRNDAPETSSHIYTIDDDLQRNNKTKEIFIPEARPKVPDAQPSLLSCRKIKPQLHIKRIENTLHDSRPFIMTIFQNKDITTKEYVPSVAGPKIYVKPKTASSENSAVLPAIEKRPSDATNNKIPEETSSKSGDNVTLVMSEPKSFEVLNVNEYDANLNKNVGPNPQFLLNGGSLTKKDSDGKTLVQTASDGGPSKKNFPILLNSKEKYLRMPLPANPKVVATATEDPNKRAQNCTCQPSRVVNSTSEVAANIQKDKGNGEQTTVTVASIEQKIVPIESGTGTAVGRFVKLTTSTLSSGSVPGGDNCAISEEDDDSDIEAEMILPPRIQMLTLTAFSNILKDILPEKWILSLDRRFGLQILKTHLDDYLNPSIMISVVVGTSGRVVVNVRGRQLEHSHDLFHDLCDAGNTKQKVSINYILTLINKLRFFNVCFGCDDLSLKKYWCEDGFIEYYTEFQQTYRSHICESLVRMGKKRCYPCYRMHESLKKRKRRELHMKKMEPAAAVKPGETAANENVALPVSQGKGVKRAMEDSLEESFINMKQRITDDIQRTRVDESNETVPKTQDEVLSFMGLTRKESLDVNLRKSKREKTRFKKCESLLKSNVNKEELYFLEKYWQDINVLFSTSLLIGAYSRTSMGRLREKCRMFYKLLSTWRDIIRDNTNWIGGYINLAENLVDDDDTPNSDSVSQKFDKMDVPALRAYIINCVKEVNKIKSRLRTKNNYFKALYNTFVKPKTKKTKPTTDSSASVGAKEDTETGKDITKANTGESSEVAKRLRSTDSDSSDENSRHSGGAAQCASDKD